MKQRSAMVVAAGLVLALALAGLGLAMGMTGPSADAKAPKPHHRRAPIVHTTTRTITVHKAGESPVSAVSASGTSSGYDTVQSSSGGTSYEQESNSGSDDTFESTSGGSEAGDD